jgi:hypothetical protein
MSILRFMGGPISRWFCAIHPNEFLIFRHGAGAHHAAVCLKCRRAKQ